MDRLAPHPTAPAHPSPPGPPPKRRIPLEREDPHLALVVHRGGRVLPWELALVRAIPLPSFAAGLVVSLALITLLASLQWMLGASFVTRSEGGVASLAEGFGAAIVELLLVGYTMAAGRYLGVVIHADAVEAGLVEARSAADGDDWEVLASDTASIRHSRAVGIAAAALWVVFERTQAALWASSASSSPPSDIVWSYACMPLLCFLLARAAHRSLIGARGGSGPRARRREVDLLDPRASFAEGRIGLRLALVWLVGSSIASLLFLSQREQGFLIALLAISAFIALLALTLPVRRAHLAIAQAKRRELDRIEPELRAARDRVLEGAQEGSGRLADLLAYRAHVEALREWPFDNGTVVRFGLYLLIPLGSWLGGALVERVVASVLD